MRAVARTPSSFAPGAGYRYNDFGHSLLGYVVERASGTSYEDYLRHRFLKPAGLEHTGFESDRGESPSSTRVRARKHGLDRGHTCGDGGGRWDW